MQRSSAEPSPAIVTSDTTSRGDDAGAIALLAAASKFRIRALLATSGNIWAEGVQEALSGIADRLRLDVPVLCFSSDRHKDRRTHYLHHERLRHRGHYAGAFTCPFPTSTARTDGLTLGRCFSAAEKSTVFVLGPCTALADALTADPALRDRIDHVYVMGGCLSIPGNSSPTAEFNIWFDPEAADFVFNAGLPTTLLTLDAITGLSYPPSVLQAHKSREKGDGPTLGRFVSDPPIFVCDEVLIALALSESVVGRATMDSLRVERKRGPDYGRLLVQSSSDGSRHRTRVVRTIASTELWRVMQSAMENGFP